MFVKSNKSIMVFRLQMWLHICVCMLFDFPHAISWFEPIRTWLKIILNALNHYSDVIMGAMASQITSITIVHSTVYSGADQRKLQSSSSLAFVRGIHRWPVNSPHKWPVTRKMFPFYDVIMLNHNDNGNEFDRTRTYSDHAWNFRPFYQRHARALWLTLQKRFTLNWPYVRGTHG